VSGAGDFDVETQRRGGHAEKTWRELRGLFSALAPVSQRLCVGFFWQPTCVWAVFGGTMESKEAVWNPLAFSLPAYWAWAVPR
jgi:hypothetical protein